jgi:protein gp37
MTNLTTTTPTEQAWAGSSSAPVGRGTSAIEWTERTLNAWDGCTKVSPGCAHCYIERQPSLRIAGRRFEGGRIPLRFHLQRLEQPIRRRKPTVYFFNSMSDTFHEDVPADVIAQAFGMMAAAPQHVFQVLTKRHERLLALLSSKVFAAAALRHAGELLRRVGRELDTEPEWPLPNVWVGVTVENRRFVHRAHYLRATPAAVRFISAEPLLGPLVRDKTTREQHPLGLGRWHTAWSDGYDGPQLNLDGIDWLIAGGESGPGHRPVRAEWVIDLRDACLARGELCDRCRGHGSIPRSLSWHVDSGEPMPEHANDPCPDCGARGRRGGPAFLFKQWGGATSKAGGRELDGRTWDEMPIGGRA